ncbi:MAG TPA: Dam family site-specific DNA-(adenine-N6)-methyltransferase [Vicinamibacterales bacterium]|nr:Dam family site-specific DNA-(adenine-N6)-methyltransferase [Vicinamibacterales bacterium]
MSESRAAVRPLLKWAGGKRQLLPELRPFYPRVFARYVEPFLGSGAVFLDLYNTGLLDGRRVALSDINADIIGCYLMVRDRPAAVIAALRALEGRHRRRGDTHFYDVRDNAFNPTRRAVHATADPAASYTPALAAMLIYLNRTGFNGLFRVNARGDFNVPAGRYLRPLICDDANLFAWSAALNRSGVTIGMASFEHALADAGQDDFIYLDPPYAPVSVTSRFTAYTAGGFGPVQQERLQRLVIALASRGASVLLSNSAAPQIKALYARDRHARTAGLKATTVSARRAINSRAASRGAVAEYLITNVARRSV